MCMKRKLLLSFVCLLFSIAPIFAQLLGVDPSFVIGSSVNGTIRAMHVYPDGRILIAGHFTTYNGTTVGRIVRLMPNGTIDPTFVAGTGASHDIRSMHVQADGKILISGIQSTYNGQPANFFNRIDSTGAYDASFTMGTGPNNEVLAITTQADGKILIGGFFSQYNGVAKSGFVRLHPNGTLDTSFTHGGNGPQFGPDAIAVLPDGRIIVGGSFNSWNGNTNIKKVVRLLPNGMRDTTFFVSGTASGNFQRVAVQADGKYIFGGSFTQVQGQTVNRIVRLDSTGAVDPTFVVGTGFDAGILDLHLQADGKLIVVGSFTLYNTVGRSRMARLHTNGTLDYGFDHCYLFNGGVNAVDVLPNGNVVIGGGFTQFAGVNQTRLIRFIPATTGTSTQPTITGTAVLPSPGSTTLYRNGGSLNGAQQWAWYEGGCGGNFLGIGDSIVVNVSAAQTWFYLRGEGNCMMPGPCDSFMVSIGSVINPPTPNVAILPNIQAFCDTTLMPPTATDHWGNTVQGTTDSLYYYNPGTFVATWTYTDTAGNSSAQTQLVEITGIDVSIDTTIFWLFCANNTNASAYHWVLCDFNYADPPSYPFDICLEGGGVFMPQIPLRVAVIITENGCTDTSDCVWLEFAGSISERNGHDLAIYPNPARDQVQFELKQKAVVRLYSALGQLLLEETRDAGLQSLDLIGLSEGMYFVEVVSENYRTRSRIVKQ
jgi:uncharacterized delta-60 repeat protein